MDHMQEAGRSGRNGEKADDIIIYYGQQLATCEKAVKDFVKKMVASGKAFYCHLIQMLNLLNPCMNVAICEQDCKCSNCLHV